MKFNGDVEKTTLQYIIRDHDREQFELRKNFYVIQIVRDHDLE